MTGDERRNGFHPRRRSTGSPDLTYRIETPQRFLGLFDFGHEHRNIGGGGQHPFFFQLGQS